jgi:hypothetical protein
MTPAMVLGRIGGVMTNQVRKVSGLILATALIAAGTASSARADERVIAKVPFAFVVGGSRLPAGKYTVKVVSEGSAVWEITSEDFRQTVAFTTISASSPRTVTTPELVFDKFDNQYFLSRVVSGYDDAREIPLTRARMEQEVIKLALEP